MSREDNTKATMGIKIGNNKIISSPIQSHGSLEFLGRAILNGTFKPDGFFDKILSEKETMITNNMNDYINHAIDVDNSEIVYLFEYITKQWMVAGKNNKSFYYLDDAYYNKRSL